MGVREAKSGFSTMCDGAVGEVGRYIGGSCRWAFCLLGGVEVYASNGCLTGRRTYQKIRR